MGQLGRSWTKHRQPNNSGAFSPSDQVGRQSDTERILNPAQVAASTKTNGVQYMTPEQQQAFTQMQKDIEAMRAELASLRELVNGSADPELEAALDEYLAEKEQKQ